MEFSKIIGKIDKDLVAKAEAHLSKLFLELAVKYDNVHVGSGWGGDPFVFSLLFPVEHICTMNIPTAATDGKRYYWNPKFILSKKLEGLRLIACHEAWHAIYMHPQRRGSRNPKLWNLAVDYIVNGAVMEDLDNRGKNSNETFTSFLGKYMTLPQLAEQMKNPFAPIKGLNAPDADSKEEEVSFPHPMEERELTEKEKKALENHEKKIKYFYADPNLPQDMKNPEKIYDYLYELLPKCPDCGRLGVYQKPSKSQKDQNQKDDSDDSQNNKKKKPSKNKNQDKNKSNDKHDHGDDEPCDCPDHQSAQGDDEGDEAGNSQGQGQSCQHGCPSCGDGIDIFDLGGTVDEHMDSEEEQEKMAKRLADAIESAKRMAGHVPGALEDELGKLVAPKVTWQDFIRTKLIKSRAGHGKNDWTKFRTRPMFCGMLNPKRRNYFASFGCLLDTSGSMSSDDMAFGLSQLQSLDDRAEGTIVPCDCQIYWEDATKIKTANMEQLSKVKVVGRGGTQFAEFFRDYENKIGKCDFLVVVTDGFLMDSDLAAMRRPDCDVIWLVTSGANFNPPFGRSFNLLDR